MEGGHKNAGWRKGHPFVLPVEDKFLLNVLLFYRWTFSIPVRKERQVGCWLIEKLLAWHVLHQVGKLACGGGETYEMFLLRVCSERGWGGNWGALRLCFQMGCGYCFKGR